MFISSTRPVAVCSMDGECTELAVTLRGRLWSQKGWFIVDFHCFLQFKFLTDVRRSYLWQRSLFIAFPEWFSLVEKKYRACGTEHAFMHASASASVSAIQFTPPSIETFRRTKQTRRRRQWKAISLYAQINSSHSLFLVRARAGSRRMQGIRRAFLNLTIVSWLILFTTWSVLGVWARICDFSDEGLVLILNANPSVPSDERRVDQMSQFESA